MPDIHSLFSMPGIISPAEAVEGFASVGILTIAVLFVVAAGVSETGSLQYITKYLMGNSTFLPLVLFRMMTPLALLSGFTNNTPLTAMMIPGPLLSEIVFNGSHPLASVAEKWCREKEIPPSKLMIPVSFATILGGVCTLIGTSTNLIVVGLAQERKPELDFPFFEVLALPFGK